MCEGVLHHLRLKNLVREWLLEDVGNFDHASATVHDGECEFTIFQKSVGMLSGIPFVDAIFSEFGLTVLWYRKEGNYCSTQTLQDFRQRYPVCVVRGSARRLLQAERVVLNVLSRASGVSTEAYELQYMLPEWKGVVAGSRKTTPGFRLVEKYALLIAGVDVHRFDLSAMVMLKDNHIALSGSIEQAVKKARKSCGFTSKIEVECQSLEEAVEACQANCDIVMFDNLEPKEFLESAEKLKMLYPNVMIEASGGINKKNIRQYISPWTDVISSSSLVQGYPTVDFSMKVTKTSLS